MIEAAVLFVNDDDVLDAMDVLRANYAGKQQQEQHCFFHTFSAGLAYSASVGGTICFRSFPRQLDAGSERSLAPGAGGEPFGD